MYVCILSLYIVTSDFASCIYTFHKLTAPPPRIHDRFYTMWMTVDGCIPINIIPYLNSTVRAFVILLIYLFKYLLYTAEQEKTVT